MKKLLFTFFIGMLSLNISFAQTEEQIEEGIETLEKGMEEMMKEMEKAFGTFETLLNQDWESKFDSIDIQKFGLDFEKLEKEFEGLDLNELNSEKMMDILRIQMEMLQDVDFSQLQELFESFNLPIPDLEDAPNNEKNNNKTTPSKKKRKTSKI